MSGDPAEQSQGWDMQLPLDPERSSRLELGVSPLEWQSPYGTSPGSALPLPAGVGADGGIPCRSLIRAYVIKQKPRAGIPEERKNIKSHFD